MNLRSPRAFRIPLLAAGLVPLLWPAGAEAHLVTTGLGPVYDGIGHFFLSPEDMIPVAALALLAGLRGARPARLTAFVLPVAWLAGGGLGFFLRIAEPVFPLHALTFLALGICVAVDGALPAALVSVFAAGLGGLHGLFNGSAMAAAATATDTLLGLIGIAAALFVCTCLITALVLSLRIPWMRIAVRVAGSWTAATGLLMIGWFAHQKK